MSSNDAIALEATNDAGKPHSGVTVSKQYYNEDDATLRRLGKRPLLTRSFGFMSVLGFSCSSLCSWESILLTSVPGLLVGGPAGMIWGLVFNWIGITSLYATMGELASIAPTSGGQYHWVFLLSPESWSYFLSYMTAWLTTLAWQSISCMVGYLIATLLQGIIILARPDYIPLAWHTMLLVWAFALLGAALNSVNSRMLAKLESLILILHLAGFFGVLVPLVYLSDHNDPSFVFTTFSNNGNWPTQGLAFMVGFPTLATCLMGADCAVHLSEEIQHAAVIVPRALMYTIFINGALALAMLIGMTFCIQDLESAVASVETLFYPCLYLFQVATQSATGACLLGGVIFALSVAASIGIYASGSRMIWSYSRDNGLPFSHLLVKLTKNSLPTNAIYTTLIINMVLSLIVLGSSVALSALLSLSIAALYSSYLMPIVLLLWRRCTQGLEPYSRHDDDDGSGSSRLSWGPWRLPEPFGTINNIFAICYGILTWFWSFWPQAIDPTPETVNWSVLVYGAVLIFSIGWYLIKAKHSFKGPIKEV